MKQHYWPQGSTVSSDLDAMQKSLQLDADRLRDLIELIEDLENKMSDAEDEAADLRGECSDLEEKLTEAQNQIKDLESRGRNVAEILCDAVKAELAKFTFPEEDRPELYSAWRDYEDFDSLKESPSFSALSDLVSSHFQSPRRKRKCRTSQRLALR